MRPLLALSMLLLLALAALPAPAGATISVAPRLPKFKHARDWQITYTLSGDAGLFQDERSSLLIVSFAAPDHVQVKLLAEQHTFVAVADAHSARIYFPRLGFALWVPGAHAPDLPGDLDISLGGPEGVLTTDWDGIAQGLRHPDLDADTVYTLLPDETVAGRACLVLRTATTFHQAPGKQSKWIVTQWFDREYGLPLGARRDDREGPVQFLARSVKINAGFDSRRFTAKIPASVPVFRGPLDLDDADTIAEFLKPHELPGGDEFSSPESDPSFDFKVTLLKPTALPAGFAASNGVSSTTGHSVEPPSPEVWWSATYTWFSKSGGVIIFTQGTWPPGKGPDEQPAPAGQPRALTLRHRPAKLLTYKDPYEGLILTWHEGGKRCRLEGTGVSADDLQKMAESMKPTVLEPRPHGDVGLPLPPENTISIAPRAGRAGLAR